MDVTLSESKELATELGMRKRLIMYCEEHPWRCRVIGVFAVLSILAALIVIVVEATKTDDDDDHKKKGNPSAKLFAKTRGVAHGWTLSTDYKESGAAIIPAGTKKVAFKAKKKGQSKWSSFATYELKQGVSSDNENKGGIKPVITDDSICTSMGSWGWCHVKKGTDSSCSDNKDLPIGFSGNIVLTSKWNLSSADDDSVEFRVFKVK